MSTRKNKRNQNQLVLEGEVQLEKTRQLEKKVGILENTKAGKIHKIIKAI